MLIHGVGGVFLLYIMHLMNYISVYHASLTLTCLTIGTNTLLTRNEAMSITKPQNDYTLFDLQIKRDSGGYPLIELPAYTAPSGQKYSTTYILLGDTFDYHPDNIYRFLNHDSTLLYIHAECLSLFVDVLNGGYLTKYKNTNIFSFECLSESGEGMYTNDSKILARMIIDNLVVTLPYVSHPDITHIY
jgi:hypothetical protein